MANDVPNGYRYQRRATIVIGVAVGLGLAALLGRLLQINTQLAPRLTAIRDGQQQSRYVLPARRGSIFDARGRVVAGSRRVYGVFADPSRIEQVSETAARVAPLLAMDAGEVEDAIRHSRAPQFCWLKRRLDDAEADAIRQARIPGIHLCNEWTREYPLGSSMAQVVGFVGADGIGLEGLELAHDELLHGLDGQAWSLRDARRRAIRAGETTQHQEKPARDGGHLILTIDSVIQSSVERHLLTQIEKHAAESGIGIVMDTTTGDVLAMASYPTFDPNTYGAYPKDNWRNRAVADQFEPGSTFKPFIASGALMAGRVSRGETFDCHDGLYVIGGRRLHDSHPHGAMSFEDVVAKSSNIGMAIIGQRMGNDSLHETVRRFGFGQQTRIDVPGEVCGLVLPVSQWTSYSTSSVTMGQELAVTPIQLITALAAIANDGVLLRPRVVRAVLSAEGDVVEEFKGPVPVRRVLPTEVARYFAREVLARVVNDGGGKDAAVPGYQVFGKTGTAQVPRVGRRGYEPGAYLSSFMGAVPTEEPRVAALIMIKKPNPSTGYYGSIVSAPAVGRILADVLAYLEVPPTAADSTWVMR